MNLRFQSGGSEAPRISQEVVIRDDLRAAGKFDEALEAYRRIKAEKPNNNAVAEPRFNSLGYSLLQDGNPAMAVSVLKIAVELYPQSWNAHDSLGEAYMQNGDKDLAIKSYKKSLQLNPHNGNAVQMLKKLQQ